MKEEGRKVAEMGGLHIVGTERHESRRIDNQLRGRAGRQGDPGSSRFYLSLEDELMRLFAGEWVPQACSSPWLGMQEGEAHRVRHGHPQIEKAQKKVEEYHFDQRKNLLEYDEVMDYQRKRTYGARQEILDGKNPRAMILGMIDDQIAAAVERFLDDRLRPGQLRRVRRPTGWASSSRPADFRGASYDEAAQDRPGPGGRRRARRSIQELIEENLNPDEDPKDWKWQRTDAGP